MTGDDADARREAWAAAHPGPYEVASVTVEAVDGRTFDLTGMTPFEAVIALRSHGVGPADIRATVHRIRQARPR